MCSFDARGEDTAIFAPHCTTLEALNSLTYDGNSTANGKSQTEMNTYNQTWAMNEKNTFT